MPGHDTPGHDTPGLEARLRLRDVCFTGDTSHIARPWRLPPDPEARGLVIFQHVPKSGGTTVDFILAAAAAARGRGYQRFSVGRFFAPPVWLVPGWTGSWNTVEEYAASMATHEPSVSEPAFSLCSGHFPFGIHRVLKQTARYVTLVRDPLAREVSSYNFHYQRGFIDDTRTLDDLLCQGVLLDNPQTRMLAGPEAMHGPCTEALWQQALRHLEQDFALVGVTEHAHAFIGALLGWLDFPAVCYVHSQITTLRRLERPSPELARRLRTVHAWDVRLHAWCQQRWLAWENAHRTAIPTTSPVPGEEILTVPGAERAASVRYDLEGRHPIGAKIMT